MQAEKRRLHAVPSCGSDRLKRHFREGSVAGISHIRKACAPREPWKIRKKRSYDSENRRIFQLVRDLQSLKKRQNSCYRRHLRAHAFFNNYQKSMCPQKTLKCTLKTKITCCSELWKWSPKTTLSGGVSCWHLPYQKSMCPSRICSFRRSLPQLGTACNLHF